MILKSKKKQLLIVLQNSLFILLAVNIGIVIAQNDPSTGTVEVDGNDPESLFDLDLDDIDHMAESDKLPQPDQVVYIILKVNYVDNTSAELTVNLTHDDGTGLASWINQTMTYDSQTDTFRTTLGGYPATTQVFYYVTVYDGQNIVRSPSAGYVYIIWDVQATTSTVPAGGGGITTPTIFFIPGREGDYTIFGIIFIFLTFFFFFFLWKRDRDDDKKKRLRGSTKPKSKKKRHK